MFRTGVFASTATTSQELRSTLDTLRPLNAGYRLLRLGPQGDGGYLVPDDLAGIGLGLSAGVAGAWGFEEDLRDRYGIPSVLIDRVDPSEDIPFPVDNAWLAPSTDVGFLSLDDWVSRRAPDNVDLILQMDIEGSEWMTLSAATPRTLRRFRIILVEFHGLHRLADKSTHDQIMAPLLHRLDRDFVCVHAHANNAMGADLRSGIDVPYLLETTWLRRDRLLTPLSAAQLPHAQDSSNVSDQPDLKLSKFWSGRGR